MSLCNPRRLWRSQAFVSASYSGHPISNPALCQVRSQTPGMGGTCGKGPHAMPGPMVPHGGRGKAGRVGLFSVAGFPSFPKPQFKAEFS